MSEITRLVKAIAPNLFDEGREVVVLRGPRGGVNGGLVSEDRQKFSPYVIRKAIRLGIIDEKGAHGPHIQIEYYARSALIKEVTGGNEK